MNINLVEPNYKILTKNIQTKLYLNIFLVFLLNVTTYICVNADRVVVNL